MLGTLTGAVDLFFLELKMMIEETIIGLKRKKI